MADPRKTLTAYLTADQAFKGTLPAKAFDASGLEIGRSRAAVELQQGDAEYLAFPFHEEMDSQLVSRYRLDLVR